MIYPLKYSLFTKILFLNFFYELKTDKPDRLASCMISVRFRVSGMPDSVWPALVSVLGVTVKSYKNNVLARP